MSLYFRKDGTPYPDTPLGMKEFCLDFENMSYRRIGLTRLPNGIEVSTVWLGINHSFGSGRPKIFESMLFFTAGKGDIGEQWRYSTEEEARLGHKMLVKKWSKFKSAEQILEATKK